MGKHRPKPPPLSQDPRASFEVEDRRADVLEALDSLRREWPEPRAINVRALSCSDLVKLTGLSAQVVREALARLDSAGAIERAPRRKRTAGVSEVRWAAISRRDVRLRARSRLR